jgi:hypothetical protein
MKQTEKRIRDSKIYDDWVKRNIGIGCLSCNSTTNLECHHIVTLYHIIHGLWKLYGNWDAVFQHALSMHENDSVEHCTLCSDCHKKIHPYQKSPNPESIHIANWTTFPRNLNIKFSHGTKTTKNGHFGLIGFQVLLGLGWYVLNGHMESRLVEFNSRRFAELLGKTPGSSFNKGLDNAIVNLYENNFILSYYRQGNTVQIHISPDYLEALLKNPWFFPMEDVISSKMTPLTLKWWLSFQSNKKIYKIGDKKLFTHLGLPITRKTYSKSLVEKSMKDIKWASMTFNKGFIFQIKKRGATPIHSLRDILEDSINQY